MLPAYYDPLDERWILQQISKLPAQYRQTALDGYSKVYQSAPYGQKRAEANTRLREYIEKCTNLKR